MHKLTCHKHTPAAKLLASTLNSTSSIQSKALVKHYEAENVNHYSNFNNFNVLQRFVFRSRF